MNKHFSMVLGAIVALMHAGKALAQDLKTHVWSKQQLEAVRQDQPEFLKGIQVNKDQVLVIQKDELDQIVNLSVFDDKNLAGNHVDGVGGSL